MKIPFFQVDAFSRKVFGGNPAAVCLLSSWLADETLQAIAAENNLSETAFLVPRANSNNSYELRWFTPLVEVDLCGHATLASAFVVFSFLASDLSSVYFSTKSGGLTVIKKGELLSMDFPASEPEPVKSISYLPQALGVEPQEILKSRDLLVVFPDEATIRYLKPDFEKLRKVKDVLGIIVTAKGDNVDFVSRFFAPNVGVPEDPVTGSAHCTLIPYWAKKLAKKRLHAWQLSKRGGELFGEYLGERVKISGNAVLYARGELYL